MKPFFQDVFEYHHKINQELIAQLIENKDQISERAIPVFSHCFNAHQIWNSRILKTKPLGVFDTHTLEKCKAIDTDNLSETIRILEKYDLKTNISYKDSKGGLYENTVKDILFHVGNHFTHHRGQIISDLRQNGITPLVSDYIFYKR